MIAMGNRETATNIESSKINMAWLLHINGTRTFIHMKKDRWIMK